MESKNLFNRYDKVHLLKTGRTDWTIRVRAQAIWKGINRQTQEFRGLNVIFIDDSNSRIHAFLSAKICDFFGDSLKEDIVRIIEDRTMSVVRSKEDEKKSYMKFRITDGRTGLNVTFFITLAEDLEKELNNLKEETVTIFIASAKVNEHEGTPCLNNYPATRFYLNIDHYSVKKMKERLLDPTFCAKEIELEGENIVPILTVAEIKKIANRIHSEINDPAEMLGSHSLGTGEATPMNEKSVSMQVDAPDMTKTSPPTAKSSNKVRSREKNENVAYELEDNPPLGKFKVVKFEKV